MKWKDSEETVHYILDYWFIYSLHFIHQNSIRFSVCVCVYVCVYMCEHIKANDAMMNGAFIQTILRVIHSYKLIEETLSPIQMENFVCTAKFGCYQIKMI